VSDSEPNIRRIQAALILQGVMGDVALHRLGLMSDRSLDVTFEREPELDRAKVEAVVDEALARFHDGEPREELMRHGAEFWESFYSAPPS
jgi:hypothetical protein